MNLNTVQQQATFEQTPRSSLMIMLASVADDIEPWGFSVNRRDLQLRSFWPTEPILASAIYNICIRNAAFSWHLDGPDRTVRAVQNILHEADLGHGWLSFITKFCLDYFTQDNGAFIEVIRASEGPDSAVVGIANLDAGRCRRTGMVDVPVIYTDRHGANHKMQAHQVIAVSEFPSAIETMNGVGVCAVSRVLRAAQLLRDISVYRREKVSGRNPTAIHLVSGIRRQEIEDAVTGHQDYQEQQGFARWFKPAILSTLDPTATIDLKTLDIKALPDGFDEEVVMRWYINQLALGFGADYQDFAPLPGRGLGTSTQSMVLHEKSRGKGPGFFMKMMEHLFNFHGVVPRNVSFAYDEDDVALEMEKAEVELNKANTRQIYYNIGALDSAAIRQQMLDEGTISAEDFDRLQSTEDITTEVVATDTERVQQAKAREGEVQSLVFDKNIFETEASAKKWAEDHDFIFGNVDETEDSWRLRQFDPDQCTTGFRTIELTKGVQAILCIGGQKAARVIEEGISDFAEEERRTFETGMAADMQAGLQRFFRLIRRRILGAKGLFGFKQEGIGNLATDPELWTDFRNAMVTIMAPYSRNVALAAIAHNLDIGIGVDMDRVNPQVLDFSRNYINDWYMALEENTRKSLQVAIQTWQESGLGSQGLPDLVDSIEPLFGRTRAERIAATEVTKIFDEGNRLAHIDAGIETEEWQTVRDEVVCAVCAPLDGRRFPTNGGPRPVTDSHINCRCARIPVVNDVGLEH